MKVESTEELLGEHRIAVNLVKTYVEANFPDVATKKQLQDGTIVDDIFYLKYVLSSKQPLGTLEQVQDSKIVKSIGAALSWRNRASKFTFSKTLERELILEIPLLKTGELKNGVPVIYLPVKEVNFDLLFKKVQDKNYEKKILNFLLLFKEKLFQSLDKKSRAAGRIIKSVSVYDLQGLSYSSIYKLIKFFKIMQAQSKVFKQYFPQLTMSTVIINAPGKWILKSFPGSSKQQVLGKKEFLDKFDARDAVPSFIGGSFDWPSSPDDLYRYHVDGSLVSKDKNLVKEITLTEVQANAKKPVTALDSANSVVGSVNENMPPMQGKQKKNMINLTYLEKEMIKMKKNKMFSVDVLEPNQKINILFSNLRGKPANVLVIIRETNFPDVENGKKVNREYNITRNKAFIRPGFGSLSITMENPGEIILVYLDRKRANSLASAPIENMSLNSNAGLRIYKSSKKMTKNLVGRQRNRITVIDTLGGGKSSSLANLELINRFNALNQLNKLSSIPEIDENLFFRFEVSDAVTCGRLDGSYILADCEKQPLISEPQMSYPVADCLQQGIVKNKEGLIDFDGQSFLSSSTEGLDQAIKSSQETSFLHSAAQVFMRGW